MSNNELIEKIKDWINSNKVASDYWGSTVQVENLMDYLNRVTYEF